MPSLIVAALAFLAPSATRGEAPSPELTVQIVTTDGKPAVGAKAWVVKYVPAVKIEPEQIPLVAGTDGKLVVADEKDAEETVRYLFVRDSQGRIGSADLSHRWIYGEENDQQIKVVLIELAEREGTIVDSSGKPIAGAAVAPKSYDLEAKTVKGSQELPSSISIPKWENKRYTVKTDAASRFKVKAPANYSMTYSVQAAGYGASRWDAKPGIALDMKLAMPGSATITAAGVPAAKLKGMTIALQYRDKLEERQAITLYRHFSATFDESGTATIEDIAPGTYELSFNSHGVLPGWQCDFQQRSYH